MHTKHLGINSKLVEDPIGDLQQALVEVAVPAWRVQARTARAARASPSPG